MKKLLLMSVIMILITACLNRNDDNDFATDPVVPPTNLKLPSGVTVQKIGEDYVWLGDILVSPKELEQLSNQGYIDAMLLNRNLKEPNIKDVPFTNFSISNLMAKNNNLEAAVGTNPSLGTTWAMVRYTYASNLTADRKLIVQQAIAHWESRTNVRFYNATGQPTKDPTYGFNYPYVEFTNSTVNNSNVGRQGGKQIINLAAYQPLYVAIHEIGHAIGFFHEQCAYNRDNFMTVNYSNIRPEKRFNFDKVTSNYSIIGSLDFNSVMIYESYVYDSSFVYDTSKPVMTKKDGSTWTQPKVLSDLDRKWANRYYLPYIARSDTYRELADVVYKPDNTVMTPAERLALQAQLNNGNPTPPAGGRIPNIP